jgi:hypothetical protein
MPKAVLISVAVLLMGAAFWLGLVREPNTQNTGVAFFCCIAAAMIFVGCHPPTGSGGRPA